MGPVSGPFYYCQISIFKHLEVIPHQKELDVADQSDTQRKDNLLDSEQSLFDAREQRDDFRQSTPPPHSGDRAAKSWGEQYGGLDDKAASEQERFAGAVRGADANELDDLTKRLEERRARKVEEITKQEGEDHLPSHAKQFDSNVQEVFRGYQGYDNGRAALTTDQADEYRQLDEDQAKLQSRLGRRATLEELESHQAQQGQGNQADQRDGAGQDAQPAQAIEFGSLEARRARGVSTYAERTAQANAAQANAPVEATPQKKRQQGNEESHGQSM